MATPRSYAYLAAKWITGYVPSQSDFEDLFASFENLVDNNALDGIDPAVTAHAGGGQASAYQITKRVTIVSTVATANDSIKLPVGASCSQCVIYNNAANAVAIFPNTGEYIGQFGLNLSFSLPQYCYCILTYLGTSEWTLQTYQGAASASSPVLFGGIVSPYAMQVNLNNNFRIDNINIAMAFNPPTGIVGDGQRITLELRDNGVARALTWDPIFQSTFAPLPSSTVAGSWWYGTFEWNATDAKWLCLSSIFGAINNSPRLVYVAQINQTGTSAPTATVFENTLGGNPVWTRLGVGHYKMALTGKLGAVGYSISGSTDVNGDCSLFQSDSSNAPDYIEFWTYTDVGVAADNVVLQLIIFVYN